MDGHRSARRAHPRLDRVLARPSALALCAACVLLAGGCTVLPRYAMDDPPSFKRYQQDEGLRMISADGVMLKVREVENYPAAELSFWVEAMERHLDARGYTKTARTELSTRGGLEGATLDFILPRGPEDWVMSETIFVAGDRIVLVEVAGPFERYQPYKDELAKALETFAINE